MPGASRDFGFDDDLQACALLRAGGYVLTRRFDHFHPDDKEPTPREWDAIRYLFEEWDYGWLVEKAHGQPHAYEANT